MSGTQHICFILVKDFSHLAFACGVEPLRIANRISKRELYRWSFASDDGRKAASSNGSVILTHHEIRALPKFDRLFVVSGINMRKHSKPELLAAIRYAARHNPAVGALCSGAWLLAKTGIMDGMKAAIHWEYHDSFMEEFPDVNLVRNVFVADEKHMTASGGTATADLMLHLIGQDHGEDLLLAVADQMVYNAVREATAEQKISLQSSHAMRNPHIVKAVQLMRESIEYPLAGSEIAKEIGISPRQLERLFGKYFNTSPKKYFMDLRLERARRLLVQTDASIIDIAMACGFVTSGHFSRVYKAAYNVTPLAQRATLG